MVGKTGRRKRTTISRWWRAWLLVSVTIVLSGCSLFNRDAAEEAPTLSPNTGRLQCTEDCAARGQCGTRDGQIQVVLGNIEEPAVEQDRHNIFFDAGTAVTVVNRWGREVEPLAGGDRQPVEFLLVQQAGLEAPRSAWVADWCFEPDLLPTPAAAALKLGAYE